MSLKRRPRATAFGRLRNKQPKLEEEDYLQQN